MCTRSAINYKLTPGRYNNDMISKCRTSDIHSNKQFIYPMLLLIQGTN